MNPDLLFLFNIFWNILYWWLLYFRSLLWFIEMALPTFTKLKINSTTMSCIPELVGQSNYPIWSTQVCSVLQAYSMFEFINGILTHNGLQDTADHNKWKMLDHHMLGLMAGIVNNLLTSNVNFDWADQQTFLSVAKAFWNKLQALLGKAEVQGTIPWDPGVHFKHYNDQVIYRYDDKQSQLLDLFYHSTNVLGEDQEDNFAHHHWMIDSGCIDHLSPFKDDFVYLGTQTRYAAVANR